MSNRCEGVYIDCVVVAVFDSEKTVHGVNQVASSCPDSAWKDRHEFLLLPI